MINEKRLVDLFSHLVSIDSPSLGERRMCDAITKLLHAQGILTEEDDTGEKIGGNAGNLYACIEGTLDLSPLLFSAHMDTVEPALGKKAVVSEDGRITSAGNTVLGADDLSGVAAILEAITALKESGLPHRPIELLFDVSEETYCTGIQHFDLSKLRSKEAYILDLSGPVGTAAFQAPSIIAFKAEFQGRAAHAAFSPEKGIHAIKAAAQAVSAISCGRVGNTTVNVGTISGGSADNVIAETCVVTGEVRSFSDEDARSQLSTIEETIKKAAANSGARAGFQTTTLCTAYCTPIDHPVIQRFKQACSQLSLTANLQQTYGGSDNNHFSQHGFTGLVIASGMNNCHSCHEYTTVEELSRGARLALSLMLSRE